MTKGLRISDNCTLPQEACTQTFAILAKRGVGKTYLAMVMAEEMLAAGLHLVVADPVGVWWGLRSSADGKSAGYPIVVFGGDHADLPLDVNSGHAIADLIIQEKLPAVLDFSLFRKGEQIRFMTDFCERLYHKNRDPLHFMMDEADAFAPQRPMPGEQRLLGAIEDIVRRGRARGLGVTLITQRAAVLNKNVLTQVEVMVALRTIAPQDRAALDAWVQVHGTPAERQALMDSLPSLPIGTAWFWSPGWLSIFQKVKVRARRTFDSSATPKVGQKIIAPKELAPVDLARIQERIAATLEKALQDDPKTMRRRIQELQRELHVAKKRAELAEQKAAKVQAVTVSPPGAVGKMGRGQLKALQEIARLAAKALNGDASTAAPTITETRAARAPARVERPVASMEGLRKGAVRILQELAARYPAGYSKPQVGALTKFSHNGGTFSTYMSDLSRAGYIEKRGDLLYATPAGIESLGDRLPSAPTSHQEAMEQWRRALRSGAYRMLEVIVQVGKVGTTKERVADAVDMVATGGTFSTYLSDLSRNGLVRKDGHLLVANDILFPGGA